MIEQFTGYFERDDVPITEWDENDMPRYPQGYHHFNCETTKLLKQPDVVMLIYLLPDEFDAEVKKANFDYYEARTLHKSSLSPSHPRDHRHRGRRHDPGGPVLRALGPGRPRPTTRATPPRACTSPPPAAPGRSSVNGFGGLRILGGRVTLNPWLPDDWEGIRFRLRWRGRPIQVSVDREHVELLLGGPPGEQEELVVGGLPVTLTAGEPIRVARTGTAADFSSAAENPVVPD